MLSSPKLPDIALSPLKESPEAALLSKAHIHACHSMPKGQQRRLQQMGNPTHFHGEVGQLPEEGGVVDRSGRPEK